MKELHELTATAAAQAIEIRHRIHRHPELGFEEFQTAATVEEELRKIDGIEVVRTEVGGTGIVALLQGEKPGPCVALRAEMDCLPIEEETDLPYASERPGLMHACGHDGHTACLLGAAIVLAGIREELAGTVKFIFQPAEEGGGGAGVLCEAGVLENPDVAAIFALHGWPWLEQGQVAVAPGPIMAGSDGFEISVHGRGGHAAHPELSVDPLLAAAQIVNALQSIVSRNIGPREMAALTIGSFQCGEAHNVIADNALLRGTLRTFSDEVANTARSRIHEIVEHQARAMGATAECKFFSSYPALCNDESAAAFVETTFKELLGENAVIESVFPVLYGEDFAFYCQKIPACFWALGVRPAGDGAYPALHQSTYDFPDEIVPMAIQLHAELAKRFLQQSVENSLG